jgi:zinc transport system ATP-binding protein
MDVDVVVKDLCVHYGKVNALHKVNLAIENKEFLGVIGPNGGGKSTLLKTIVGLIEPTNGSIEIKEGLHLGYVPQFTSFEKSFPTTVEDVVLMGEAKKQQRWFYRTHESSYKKSEELMRFLNIYDLRHRQIGQLSGGQMQKVLIARALMNDPDLIAMDEPTASIDAQTKMEIYNLLHELNEEKTIVIVSHEVESLMPYLDSVFCVNTTAHYYHRDETHLAKHLTDDMQNLHDELYPGCPVKIFKEHETVEKS